MSSMERKEGKVAKSIEKQTSKLPSDLFLWTAVGAMAVSLGLKVVGQRHLSLFFGLWPAPFLILGLYNKLVKLEGHDKEDKGENEEKWKKEPAMAFSQEGESHF